MKDVVLAPSDFVGLLNQTLEYAYPVVVIEGELANFRVSKNRWVYFDIKDELASVAFFGTVYSLPGRLEDGFLVRAVGAPRLHPRFGFSVNFQSVVPAGEGSIKKAADLLFKQLEVEGIFAVSRKRALPDLPARIGLITAADSAAAADFIKIANQRWAGLEIRLVDCLVQGEQAPGQLIRGLEYLNQLPEPPDLIVMVRGGGSADDLAAFSDERLVRAVAASRVQTLVAIGHETDTSLAELAADARASTPSNAAQAALPDKKHQLELLGRERQGLSRTLAGLLGIHQDQLAANVSYLNARMLQIINQEKQRLASLAAVTKLLDPAAALARGYAIVKRSGRVVTSAKFIKPGDKLELTLRDGKIRAVAGKN